MMKRSMTEEAAFPSVDGTPGMSLRDWFAVTLATGITLHIDARTSDQAYATLARTAYRMADAMLVEREHLRRERDIINGTRADVLAAQQAERERT